MKTKAKHRIWRAILLIGLILFFATGCKPKQIIQERTITKVDSTAIVSLKSELQKKTIEVETLKTDLERFGEDNTRLQEEVSKYEVEYDTSGPVNPQTGKPPVKKETTTNSKSLLEKMVKDYEIQLSEYKKEVETITTKNNNLEYEVKQLRDENSELKSKTIPQSGNKLRLIIISFLAGIAAPIAYFIYRKNKRLINSIFPF